MHPAFIGFGYRTFVYDDRAGLELVNNYRLMKNIEAWNRRVIAGDPLALPAICINAIFDCAACLGAERFFAERYLPFGQRYGYAGVDRDPVAPWYTGDPSHASFRFLGVMGLSVTGVHDGLRNADVRTTADGHGYVGRLLTKPRTIVINCLAVAVDQGGMVAGLDWIRDRTEGLEEEDPQNPSCAGDWLWFLDECPPCIEESAWDEFFSTPPTNVPDPEPCLYPLLRGFARCRVIEGPVVQSIIELPSGGVVAEIELIVIAPDGAKVTDPFEIHPQGSLLGARSTYTDPPTGTPIPDPFDPSGPLPPIADHMIETGYPSSWTRLNEALDDTDIPMLAARYAVTVQANEQMEWVRIGIWTGTNDLVFGFSVPFIPAGGILQVDGITRTINTHVGTAAITHPADYVHDWDGGVVWRWTDAPPHEDDTYMTVDFSGSHQATALTVGVEVQGRSAP